jgi:hypothetical protein
MGSVWAWAAAAAEMVVRARRRYRCVKGETSNLKTV